MAKHLQRELEVLKKNLLATGAMVEEAIEKACIAFDEHRSDLAGEVIQNDARINRSEVEVEEACLKILALYQPVAEDLRFIATVIRINSDLERMGDYAVSIAERANHLMKSPIPVPKDMGRLAQLAKKMVRDSLDAFVRRDTKFARQICANDDDVDGVHRTIIEEIRDSMKKNPDQIDSLLDLFTTARRLERIADMSTNIAQDVVYMVEGEIIRHRPDQYPRLAK
jgi:phosphate transport system protein